MQRLIEFTSSQVSFRRRDIAEANVGALWLGEQTPAIAYPDEISEITRQRKHTVDVRFETTRALCLPHEPKLDDIGAASALYVPVAAVECRIIEFVILKEVARAAAMRRL